MNVYLATNNQHKVEEISAVLSNGGLSVHSAKALGGMPEVDEVEKNFKGNAILKAKALIEELKDSNDFILADDSGLVVDCLGGAPGVLSARYAGEGASDVENYQRLLSELRDLDAKGPFSARFVCCLVLLNSEGFFESFEGTCEGEIVLYPKGENGFGYDPVFKPNGFSESMAELSASVKNSISHRGNALTLLAKHLKKF